METSLLSRWRRLRLGQRPGAPRYGRPLSALLLLAAALICTNAWAGPGGRGHGGHGHHHSRSSFGLSIGMPLYWGGGDGPGWYGDPYWSAPRPIIVRQAAPVVYVERSAPAVGAAAAAVTSQWYYCSNPQGYYPYVKQCTSTWQTVPAQPVRH